MEDFIDNLEISEDDKNLLREYCHVKDDIEEVASFKSSRRLDKIKDFIQSADPAVRNRAEYKLEQVLSDMKYLRKSGMLDRMSKDYHDFIRKNPSDPERSVDKAESSDDETEPAQAHVQASVHGSDAENSNDENSLEGSEAGMPEAEEGDPSTASQASDLTWDHGHDIGVPIAPEGPDRQPIPDININLPNIHINIRQPRPRTPDPPIVNPIAAGTPVARPNVQNPFAKASKLNRTPVAGTSRQDNVRDWIEGRSPQHGPDPPPDLGTPHGNPEVTTRSGRISKPPARFDPSSEVNLQSDIRTAMKRSLAERKAADVIAQKAAKNRAAKAAEASKAPVSKAPATVVSEKGKKTTTAKTTVSKTGFKLLSESQYNQLSYTDKRAYTEAKERDAASKAAASTKAPVVESEKSKSTAARAKPADLESTGGDPVKATSSQAPDVDITARSSKTMRTPVKDDASAKTTKTNPSGANRLPDEDDNLFD